MEMSTKEDAVRTIMKELDARHENVIRMYFGLGEDSKTSIKEIGQDFDLTIDEVIELKNEEIRVFKDGSLYLVGILYEDIKWLTWKCYIFNKDLDLLITNVDG